MPIPIYGELQPLTGSKVAVRAENVAVDENNKKLSEKLIELNNSINEASEGDFIALSVRMIEPSTVFIDGKKYRTFEYSANITLADLNRACNGSFGTGSLGICFLQNYLQYPELYEVWRLDGFEPTPNQDGTICCYLTPMFGGNMSTGFKPNAKVIHPIHKVYGEANIFCGHANIVESNQMLFTFETYMTTCFNNKVASDGRFILIDNIATTNWKDFIRSVSPDGLPVPVSGVCDTQKSLGMLLGIIFEKVDPRITLPMVDISPTKIRCVNAWVADFEASFREFSSDDVTKVNSATATLVTMIPCVGTLNRMRL